VILLESGVAQICPCREQKRLEKLFKSSEVTPAFRSKTFENYEANRIPEGEKILSCAREYAEKITTSTWGGTNWMVLLGEPGCGKTHLSMAVANQLIRQQVPVLYFQHVEGFSEMKDMLRNEHGIKKRLDQMKKVQLLVWDDLWKRKKGYEPRPFEYETVFEVLNYRYLNLLPTIISSEKMPQELLEIDKAIGSRILERGKRHLVVVEGLENNYRLK
jgi:DNA replication protein DnaC